MDKYYADVNDGGYTHVIKDERNQVIFKSTNVWEVELRVEFMNTHSDSPEAMIGVLQVMEITGQLTVNGYDLIEELKDILNGNSVQPTDVIEFGNEVIGGNTYNPDDYQVKSSLKSKRISEW